MFSLIRISIFESIQKFCGRQWKMVGNKRENGKVKELLLYWNRPALDDKTYTTLESIRKIKNFLQCTLNIKFLKKIENKKFIS